jgi:hypothetical protein
LGEKRKANKVKGEESEKKKKKKKKQLTSFALVKRRRGPSMLGKQK